MYRERLTITLNQELLKAVDAYVDGSSIRNRSHAIEHVLREGLAVHELTQAFLLLSEPLTLLLPNLITLCTQSGIREFFIVSLPEHPELSGEIAVSLAQLAPQSTSHIIPGDFGTAGALILQKEKLHHPFLIVELNDELILPTGLESAFSFHRRQAGILTTLITSEDAVNFRHTGFSFANPTLLDYIPAGITSLESTVFPSLLKAGKVKGYVYGS